MSQTDRDSLLAAFPNLIQFEITSPRDFDYNCIAWAVERDDAWLWPDSSGTATWPEDAPREETLDAFHIAFESLGYNKCESDDLEPGLTKIAVFAFDGQPTHAARQLADGRWTSKCGQSFDITHELSELEGTTYGTVMAVYSKPTGVVEIDSQLIEQ